MAGKRMPEKTTLTEKFVSGEEVELQEHRPMIYLPENSIAVRIIATVYEEDEVHEVHTDEGKAYLDELKKGRST